jgi:Flp pilus assembly protein TadG
MTPLLQRQRGAVAIMTALAMLVLLAVVGLVIDGGLAYMVKARLNAAVDSAALAGARAVPAGNNQAEQIASARAAAADFFAANIPSNYLLSKPTLLSTDVSFNQGQATIDVRAEAPMPVSFMQVMGFTSLKPVAYAQTIRRDLDMAFVVDTSGSLSGQAATVRASAKSFLNKFNLTQDRVGLMHFASGAEVDFPINTLARGFNRAAMLKKIDSYTFVGGTASVEGMWNARDQLNAIPLNNRSTQRVIVFFSDGDPSAFGSYITFANGVDCSNIAGVIEMGSPHGLSSVDGTVFDTVREDCRVIRNNRITTRSLPAWYNAHNSANNQNDVSKREFPVVTNTPRVVTADISTQALLQRNVERASRNLVEAVAAKARDEGIVVFTLGLGDSLKTAGTYDSDTGEQILKCMANVADAPSRCYNSNKPVGMYCYAASEADLTPCFSRLASAILRITR